MSKKLMIRAAADTLYELKTDATEGLLFTIEGLTGSTAYVVHDWNAEIAFTTPAASEWAEFTFSSADAAGSYNDGTDEWYYAQAITPGNYTVTVTKAGYAEIVVIGGGGGGGKDQFNVGGGGGEAGKVEQRVGVDRVWLPLGVYRAVVGPGGAGGSPPPTDDAFPLAGSASSFGVAASGFADLAGDAVTAPGGGFGGQRNPLSGNLTPAPGGGNSRDRTLRSAGVTGFLGGERATDYGGGGAGNGGNGGNAVGALAGIGGAGVDINITGTVESVGGGGAGSGLGTTSGHPRTAGGGATNVAREALERNGVDGTGGGGAGGRDSTNAVNIANCNGGSGRVALRTRVIA